MMEKTYMARILLVEDDLDQCREYAIYLRSAQGGAHQVDEAQSATSAVHLLADNKYHLVLLDIMMPYKPDDQENQEIQDHEVDYGRKMGLYVYKKIRELPNPPPVGLVSVMREPSVLAEFPEVRGHLAKYFSLDELGRCVERWLQ
jgi:CheY-like chemotaxis protein